MVMVQESITSDLPGEVNKKDPLIPLSLWLDQTSRIMKYRRFGRTEWQVSEVGYGMWGLAGWTNTDKAEVAVALDKAVELGCNFFDTAWAYGDGVSERILADLLKRHASKRLYAATKVPPKDRNWPPVKGNSIRNVFPADYLREYTEKSLQNLDVDTIDLLQLHVWEDAWAGEDEWKSVIQRLKEEGKIRAFGLSLNRWEPENGMEAIRTGLVDAVQVIYNIFDQNPEDELFPLCRNEDIGVIARVPFDEGGLIGHLTKDTQFPEHDWRAGYFCEENLIPTIQHADALKPLVPSGSNLPEMALRFILSNPDVATVIPGMRQVKHVDANIKSSALGPLDQGLINALRPHRWVRKPTSWSM